MSTIEEFIKKLESELEFINDGVLNKDTTLTSIDSWSSMHSLILIAFINMEYGIVISGEELMQNNTIEQLHLLILKKSN